MNDKTLVKTHKSFGFVDFLWRWLLALLLVFLSYNPSGWSWFHWARLAFNGEGLGPIHYFTGVILVAGWTMLIIATQRSLGMLGSIIGAALIVTGLWLLVDIGVLSAGSMSAISWLALFALATLLAVGLSWSHVWRRLSGQLEVDDD
ncbi:MAG TPA: DUF6524 family protein [Xanthomonadales bacterium]|nr:DUF6524 family protein [Xanthomonadales bacterium]